MIDHINLDQIIKADESITKDKKIALAVLTADCAPIFIFDKKKYFYLFFTCWMERMFR